MDENIGYYEEFCERFVDYKSSLENAKENLLNKTKIRRENGVYTIVNVGMGCCIYLTYNFKYKRVMGYFMHGDCYGQYGVNDLPKALDFVKNYKEV